MYNKSLPGNGSASDCLSVLTSESVCSVVSDLSTSDDDGETVKLIFPDVVGAVDGECVVVDISKVVSVLSFVWVELDTEPLAGGKHSRDKGATCTKMRKE